MADKDRITLEDFRDLHKNDAQDRTSDEW